MKQSYEVDENITGATTEPVAIGGAIMGVAAAGATVAMAFGAPITEEQWAVVLGLLSTLIVLVTTIQRRKVFPVSKLRESEQPK